MGPRKDESSDRQARYPKRSREEFSRRSSSPDSAPEIYIGGSASGESAAGQQEGSLGSPPDDDVELIDCCLMNRGQLTWFAPPVRSRSATASNRRLGAKSVVGVPEGGGRYP